MRADLKLLAMGLGIALVCALGIGVALVFSANHTGAVSSATAVNSSGSAPTNLSGITYSIANGSSDVESGEPDRSDSIYFGLEYGPQKYYRNANVTLYRVLGYNTTTNDDDLSFVNISGNPLHATNYVIGGIPVYRFDGVPAGSYRVIAEKGGKVWTNYLKNGDFMYLTVDDLDITIPDGVVMTNSTIYGFVRDETGRYIPGAVVSLAGTTSRTGDSSAPPGVENRSVVSGEGSHAGFYCFQNVTPGWYSVSWAKEGYTPDSSKIQFRGKDANGTEVWITMISKR